MTRYRRRIVWFLFAFVIAISGNAAAARGLQTLRNRHFAKFRIRFLARSIPLPRTSFSNDDTFLASIQLPNGEEVRAKLVYSFQLYESEIPTDLIESGDAHPIKIQRLTSCDSTYGAMISVAHIDAGGKILVTRDGLRPLADASLEDMKDQAVLKCYRITPAQIPKRFRE